MDYKEELEKMQTKMADYEAKAKELGDWKAASESLQEKFDAFAKLVGEKKDGDDVTMQAKLESLNDALGKCQEELKEAQESKDKEFKTLGDALQGLTKKDSPFCKMAENIGNKKSDKGMFEIKATVLSAALTGNRQRSIIEAGVDKPRANNPFLRDIVPNMPTNSPVIYWTERKTHTDGTGGVAEGTAAGASGSTWEEKNRQVVTRGVNYKFSNKAFRDVPQLIADLREDVVRDMELDIDNQILTGDGSGQNFFGLIADATAFDAASVNKALAVVTPNLADLIKCVALQAEIHNFMPTHALVNPVDFVDLELTKNKNGDYVLPPFSTADGRLISGVTIVKNNAITKDTLLVFDRNATRFYINDDMRLQVFDQNEDDAAKGLKTVCLWFDGQMRVRKNDKLGIIKVASIAAAITAITKA